MVPLVAGLSSLLDGIDLIICDIWGVLHDGLSLHQDAADALLQARTDGVQTVFLSNAPRPRHYVIDQLLNMGLPHSLTNKVVTSGGLARDDLRRNHQGHQVYHVGPKSDENTIEDLDIVQVDRPEDADVILATDLDFRDVEHHRDWLRPAAEKGVPFICANPDRIVHVGDRLIACAGAVADLYIEMGGPVVFYGKPEKASYLACFETAGLSIDTPANRVLMIGDSARTDIAGANALGYKSVLITGGIHRDGFAAQWAQGYGDLAAKQVLSAIKPFDELPTWLMRSLTF